MTTFWNKYLKLYNMKIEIEDYFGNSVIILEFFNRTFAFWQELLPQLENLSIHYGYDVADYETDTHMRLQQVNVDNSETEENADLSSLVSSIVDLAME